MAPRCSDLNAGLLSIPLGITCAMGKRTIAANMGLSNISGICRIAATIVSLLLAHSVAQAVGEVSVPPMAAAQLSQMSGGASCKFPSLVARAANAAPAATSAPAEWAVASDPSPVVVSLRDELAIVVEPHADLGPCIGAGSDVTLFIDQVPLQGLLIRRYVEEGKIRLTFRLERQSNASWAELLRRAWDHGGPYLAPVGIGTGTTQLAALQQGVSISIGSGSRAAVGWALAICIVVLVVVWGSSKAIVDRKEGRYVSYSLSRLVLACWILTTCATVIIIWRHTGSLPSFGDGGLAVMLAATGVQSGAGALIDLFRKPANVAPTRFWQDFLDDADGLALHRIQVVLFNILVLYVVWTDLYAYGTVAAVDKSWSALIGASALTYLLGKSAETMNPTIPSVPKLPAPADVAAALRQMAQGNP